MGLLHESFWQEPPELRKGQKRNRRVKEILFIRKIIEFLNTWNIINIIMEDMIVVLSFVNSPAPITHKAQLAIGGRGGSGSESQASRIALNIKQCSVRTWVFNVDTRNTCEEISMHIY